MYYHQAVAVEIYTFHKFSSKFSWGHHPLPDLDRLYGAAGRWTGLQLTRDSGDVFFEVSDGGFDQEKPWEKPWEFTYNWFITII